jgi:hypothetical protein
MTKYFEMILAIETPSFNKMKNWRVYQKMRHKAEVRNAITKAILSSDEPFPRLNRAYIVYTRFGPRTLDKDNMVPGCKYEIISIYIFINTLKKYCI